MEKQTAVEFLISKLQWTYGQIDAFSQYVREAKEMEKQQVIDAYNIGFIYPIEFDFNTQKSVTAEQYYNETFKSE